MPVVAEMVHPKGLSFASQRDVVMLREVRGLTFPDIAKQVYDLTGKHPKPRLCREYYMRFNRRSGRAASGYSRCGRKKWKVTKEVERYIVNKLKEMRTKCVCTSTILQMELAKEKRVELSASMIRKVLKENGYQWRVRRQKRKYSNDQKKDRLEKARRILRLTRAELREKLSFAMDGVVVLMPPADPIERLNWCRFGETYIYRKLSEAFDPELSGDSEYGKQAPMKRALAMWAGCSQGGLAVVCFHDSKKIRPDEWARAVRKGKLVKAIKALKPVNTKGPWHVLSDNEHFLSSPSAVAAHKAARVKMWHIPSNSPDMNPAERCWAWLKKKMRAMDLADAIAGRPVLSKKAYKARLLRVINSKKCQNVCAKIAGSLKKVCQEIVRKKGAASSG